MKKTLETLGDSFAKADQSFFNAYGRFYEGLNALSGGLLSAFCHVMTTPSERLYRMETTSPSGHTQIEYITGGGFPGWDDPKMLKDGSIQHMYLC